MWAVLLAAQASGGVPIALPPGEEPSNWSGTLALGQLEWASATSADVHVVEVAGRWTVRVSDPDGAVRTASVAIPSTPESREDLVWLVVSLLTPVTSTAEVETLSAPAPRAPAPALASTQPRPTEIISVVAANDKPHGKSDDGWEPEGWAQLPPVPKPPPTPERTLPPAKPQPSPRNPIIRVPPPPKAAVSVMEPWLRLTADASLRSEMPLQGTVGISAGETQNGLGLGAGLAISTRTPLLDAGEDRRYGSMPLFAELLFTPTYGLLGVQGGFELRRFREETEVIALRSMPFVRIQGAVPIYLGRSLWVEPLLAYRLDLGVTEVQVGGVYAQRLPASSWQGGIAMRWR